MAKLLFGVMLSTHLHLSPRVIRRGVGPGFAAMVYPLATPDEVAEYVGYNMAVNGLRLSQIDGFADLPDGDAELEPLAWESATELLPAPPKKRKARR